MTAADRMYASLLVAFAAIGVLVAYAANAPTLPCVAGALLPATVFHLWLESGA